MKLRRYLVPERIRLGLDLGLDELDPEMPRDKYRRIVKERVMHELAILLSSSGKIAKPKRLATDLLNREKKATTAIGRGIAIPHVRTRQAKELVMAVAISREGVDFGAVDDQPVHVFVSLVAPAHDDRKYLEVVQRLAELFRAGERNEDEDLEPEWGVREQLIDADEPADVIWALSTLD